MFEILTNTGLDKEFYIRAQVNLEFAGTKYEVGRVASSSSTQGKFDHDIIIVKLIENLDPGIRGYLTNSRSGYNFEDDTIKLYPQDYKLV